MINGQPLKEFKDFQECRIFNYRIEIESIEDQNVIDSGVIERIEEPNCVIMNGKVYKIDDYLFFYRPFTE